MGISVDGVGKRLNCCCHSTQKTRSSGKTVDSRSKTEIEGTVKNENKAKAKTERLILGSR